MSAIPPDIFIHHPIHTEPSGYPPLTAEEVRGRVQNYSFNFSPAGSITAGKVLALCKLPAGARILTGIVESLSCVATAVADIGLSAADGSGVIDAASTADSANLFTALAPIPIDTDGAYPFANQAANNQGYKLYKECYLTLALGTAGMTGATSTLKGNVYYVIG